MMFEIVYHDGVEKRELVGSWSELPDDFVQFVGLFDPRGSVRVSGYDSYAFDKATGLFSVFYDDPKLIAGRRGGHLYLLRPGVAMEYLGDVTPYRAGEIPYEATDARIKRGFYLDDETAEELGFRPKEWRRLNNVSAS